MNSSCEMTCNYCRLPAALICERCHGFFCSSDHLDLLHDHASSLCFPVRVHSSPTVGNFFVATKNLEPLDIILKDTAQPSGPLHGSKPVCLTCFNKISKKSSYVNCQGCELPMCTLDCAQNWQHVNQECKLFQDHKIKFEKDDPITSRIYSAIFVLRMLLLSESNGPQWNKINRLMDHKADRKKDSLTWDTLQREVVDFIRIDLNLGERFSEDKIHHCLGIGCINGVQAEDETQSYRCLFPTMAILSSECIPNAKCLQTHDPLSLEKGITVLAQTRIDAGTEVTIQYNRDYHMTGSRQRRQLFRDIWYFDCSCRRCADPTENGSYLNGLNCPKCRGGIVLAKEPLNYKSTWSCSQCAFSMEDSVVDALEKEAEKDIKATLKIEKNDSNFDRGRTNDKGPINNKGHTNDKGPINDKGPTNDKDHTNDKGPTNYISPTFVDQCESLVVRLSKQFHSHHFLSVRVKSQLISQYGNVPGYLYESMTTDKIRHKISLCNEFIQVFDLVEPGGYTDWWAATTYEAVKAEVVCLNRDLESGQICSKTLKEVAQQMALKLERIVQILEVEPPGSYLKVLADNAKKDQASIDDLIRFADFL